MKTLSIKIPEKLDRQLTSEVARRHVPKSVLVREVLSQHFSGASSTGKQSSFLERAGDVIGRYSGPGDVSTNPKYMKDFGK